MRPLLMPDFLAIKLVIFLSCSERFNDIATPCVINLLFRVVLFQSASFALAVG